MSLLSYLDERRVLVLGARRFVVRRPTFGAVLLFTRLFALEIVGAWEAYESDPDSWLESLPSIDLDRDPRVARLLASFIEGDGEPSTWPHQTLYEAVAGMSDLPRIIASLRLGQQLDVGRDRSSMLKFAAALGTNIVALMGWPYDAVLEASEALRDDASEVPDKSDYFMGGLPSDGIVYLQGGEA